MPVKKLKEFLDENGAKYVNITHSKAYTAQEIAASAHISGKNVAKTVIVDIEGQKAMTVMPANHVVDTNALEKAFGIMESTVRIATEDEFSELFPSCEVGAMPPFGNLYGMEVFVDTSLTEDEEIAFNAGSHSVLLQLAYETFTSLAKPKVGAFTIIS